MAERVLLGALLAALITAAARRYGLLGESGQWGAFFCGVGAAAAGWMWALLLITYFVAATLVTRLGAEKKAERTLGTNPQVPYRDAMQVFANGAVFCLAAIAFSRRGTPALAAAAAGALAAASADTWATEIGTLWGGAPRSILGFGEVQTGMSGGVTPIGTLAAVAGAALVAGLAGWTLPVAGNRAFIIGVVTAGVAGALADSLLGATLQARRWCDRCRQWTERRVHPCGYRTVHARGYRWMSNDAVNLGATVVGATAAVLLTRVAR